MLSAETVSKFIDKLLAENARPVHLLRATTNAGKTPRSLGQLLAIAYRVNGKVYVCNAVNVDVAGTEIVCAIRSYDPDFATKDSFERMGAGNAAVLELFELYPEAVDNHFSRTAA
jgi:hypothetical protein